MCVARYCFCSDYGLMIDYKNNNENYLRRYYLKIGSIFFNFQLINLNNGQNRW